MAEFPLLQRQVHGKRLVYLDSAATTQKPHQVLRAMDEYYEQHNANIHRGIYTLSEEATRLYEEAREHVARLVHAPARNIVFTSGCTDALNMVAHALPLQRGDEILLTPHEHHANIVPWHMAAARSGAKVLFCDLKKDGTINIDHLKSLFSAKTRVLAITHVSNFLGTVTPLQEIVPYARERAVIVVVDGAQAAGHMPVDVPSLGCDFYAFSGHKMLGPTGIGALYLDDRHYGLVPYRTGGDMIDDVTEEGAEFAQEEPRRFEAGTPNIAGAIGMGAAATYLLAHEMEKVHAHELALASLAWKKLASIPEIELYGPSPQTGIVSFNVLGVHAHDVAQVLDGEDVSIRSGKHCVHPLLRRLDLEAANRASFALYNTEEDVAALCDGIRKVVEVFR